MDVAAEIRGFIQEEILFGDGSVTVADDTPLYEGIVDSLALMDLVTFLEERFGVVIEDADLTNENFRTVAAIEQLVRRRADGG